MKTNGFFHSNDTTTGITRVIDELGRLVIQAEVRKELGMFPKEVCKIIPYENGIFVQVFHSGLKLELKKLIDKYDMNFSDPTIIERLKGIYEEMTV